MEAVVEVVAHDEADGDGDEGSNLHKILHTHLWNLKIYHNILGRYSTKKSQDVVFVFFYKVLKAGREQFEIFGGY